MESKNESSNPPAENCVKQNDRRTFLIAFLTTVILLALYHFGTGLFAIFSGSSDFCTIPVTREYVLVPVSAMPRHGGGMGMMGGGPRGQFRGPRRGGAPDGAFHRGGMGHHGEHGHHPDAAPEVPPASPEAEVAPAPAAAE